MKTNKKKTKTTLYVQFTEANRTSDGVDIVETFLDSIRCHVGEMGGGRIVGSDAGSRVDLSGNSGFQYGS